MEHLRDYMCKKVKGSHSSFKNNTQHLIEETGQSTSLPVRLSPVPAWPRQPQAGGPGGHAPSKGPGDSEPGWFCPNQLCNGDKLLSTF